MDRFACWPVESPIADRVPVYRPDGTAVTIAFPEVVAVHDGVFFFGWDETSRIAVWKWAPAKISDTNHGAVFARKTLEVEVDVEEPGD